MTTVVIEETWEERSGGPPTWALVVSGVLWILISLLVLTFSTTAVATIGYIVGAVVILAGIDEFMIMTVAPGWKWLHAALGVLFLVTGVLAFLAPLQTFGILAVLFGWYLIIKGTFDVVLAIGARQLLPLWGLGLALGIVEILVGLWAIGYPGRSAWLLILWIGIGTMMRGIGDLVLAFTHGGSR